MLKERSNPNSPNCEFRLTYVFKRSCQGFCALAIWFLSALAAAHSNFPKMRGCNEARPSRDLGEQGLQLQRASAESAKTRGASFSEPAALKVQLCAVAMLCCRHGRPKSGRNFPELFLLYVELYHFHICGN